MNSIKIKICCIKSIEEAKTAIHYGATAIGLVSSMPSGHGIIDDELIAEIVKNTPSTISTFLLTSETKADDIIMQYNKVQTTTIQLVDELEYTEYKNIRNELPEVELVQVIHVIDEQSIHKAIEVSKYVDMLLLDSGNPNIAVKELGGTGRTHDWKISRKIRETVSIPVFLAGGINKTNVIKAIDIVQPHGIDLCSGIRTQDHLDEHKLSSFFECLSNKT